jgi:hypothetical protein
MANQYAQRNWKQEMAETAARLSMCVFVPDRLTANTRVRCSCLHGVVKETTVIRFVERQYCCKSQASKAHDPAMKARAAQIAWSTRRDLMLQRQKERWSRPGEKKKHSQFCLEAHEKLREEGWVNPGWGWKPSESERPLPGTLYLIRYLDESGTHFKIGITKLTLAERFKPHQLISTIHLHTATLGECFDLEQDCLRHCKQQGWRYSSPTTTELIHPDGLPYLLGRFAELHLS